MNIYKNTWAGYDCYFVHTHTDKSRACGYRVHNACGKWKADKVRFSKATIEDTERFPKVGEIDLNKIIIENVLKEGKHGESKS